MKTLPIAIVVLMFGAVAAAEENCEGFVPLESVQKICGQEFIRDKASASEKRCRAHYIEKSMGEKYVGNVGISSELIFKKNKRINRKGKNTAPISFKSSLDGAKQRGTFRKDVAGLGEGAFYSELDIHQTVTWYQGEYLYNFTVDKGQRNGEDWLAPCTPEQTIELAKIIGDR